ncbi:MAG: heparan-alpha-glucosaminide N-acetyltransferase domain-containing protein [Bacteroidia bacterium]|nr:heparan-alpha-glucosaminide N-acetyltransferase domain-containing protein [Bacteroidia bacterium]
MKELFAKEYVNSGRQKEFDLIRGITIFFMVFNHAQGEMFGFEPGTAANLILNLHLNILGAAAFMTIMGVAINYTRHNKAEDFLNRGWILLLTAFSLTALRDALPNMVSFLAFGNGYSRGAMMLSIGGDILQFAGLAFLLIGLLKKLNIGHTGMLLIAVALNAAGFLLNGVQTGNYVVNQFLGYFWGTYSEDYFPLFHWFIFPVMGYVFGDCYKRLADKDRFFLIAVPACAAFSIATILIEVLIPEQQIFRCILDHDRFCYMAVPDAVRSMAAFVAVIGIMYWLTKVLSDKALSPLYYLSMNISVVYCTSWVLISLTTFSFRLLKFWPETQLQTTLVSIGILVVTILLTNFYKAHREFFVGVFGKHRMIWAMVVTAIIATAVIMALQGGSETFPNYHNGYHA